MPYWIAFNYVYFAWKFNFVFFVEIEDLLFELHFIEHWYRIFSFMFTYNTITLVSLFVFTRNDKMAIGIPDVSRNYRKALSLSFRRIFNLLINRKSLMSPGNSKPCSACCFLTWGRQAIINNVHKYKDSAEW